MTIQTSCSAKWRPAPTGPGSGDTSAGQADDQRIQSGQGHAKSIVDAIVAGIEDGDWDWLDELCTDADGMARRFTTLEILRLVEEVAGAASRPGKRADALRTKHRQSGGYAKAAKLKPLVEFAVRMHDKRKWKSASHAARVLLRDVLDERIGSG